MLLQVIILTVNIEGMVPFSPLSATQSDNIEAVERKSSRVTHDCPLEDVWVADVKVERSLEFRTALAVTCEPTNLPSSKEAAKTRLGFTCSFMSMP